MLVNRQQLCTLQPQTYYIITGMADNLLSIYTIQFIVQQ